MTWISVTLRNLLLVVCISLAPAPLLSSPSNGPKEVRLGNEAAKDVEREVTVLEDPVIQQKLDRIGQRLAQVAKVTQVEATYGSPDLADFGYRFRIIDDEDVNAFALPGGHIYVNKGLIDYVRSDDELAAVLAHEIAHVSHHHSVKLLEKQSRMNVYIAALTLLGAISDMSGRDLQNLIYGAQLVRTSKLGGYGQEAELDADRTSVTYMVEADYDPCAILTFLTRLSGDMQRKPNLPLGIFRTHPPFRERADNITAELARHGVEYDVSGLSGSKVAVVRGTHLRDGLISEVAIAGKTILRPAGTDRQTSSERAAEIAAAVNSRLSETGDLASARISCDSNSVSINGQITILIEQADAQLHGTTTGQIAKQARDALGFAVWCSKVRSIARN